MKQHVKARRHRTLLTFAAATAMAALSTTSAQAAQQLPADFEINRIVNQQSGFCLEVNDGNPENGARAQQWSCAGGTSAWMRWRWEKIGPVDPNVWGGGGTVYRIRNASTNKCLEVADSRLDNGAPVQQWTCENVNTQKWILDHDPWTFRTAVLANLNSLKCLEIPDASVGSNGALAHQWTCGEGIAQKWDY
ncbi:RICIN domain-containing protein [Streptomyces sp. NPDC048200]|uniref:RICIN domain-containing protein n=1 Tax=Streptomyces sp. NPDC048200 TaxID=3365512 RepID=UPI003710C015